MHICVNAERGTHQGTYTYRYIAKPVQSSLSSLLPPPPRPPKRLSKRARANACLPVSVCIVPPRVSGAFKGGWVCTLSALEIAREPKSG